MCLFPKKTPLNSEARKYGILEFDCGVCPECLRKKASQWALRATYHAKDCDSMMICLTYDQYIRNSRGLIVGERVASDMRVDKRDCQLFIKRLRKAFPNNNIKYIISAEYGKRTHRPHYHVLIFGLKFDDLIQYKKSKRGNLIYKSKTLENIWGNGICTVDAVNIRSSMARYCTKYAMKDKQVDTFMLFSRDIGTKNLMKDFNGISYWIDGHEYPIPKLIWRDYLCNKLGILKPMYRSWQWCVQKYGYYHTHFYHPMYYQKSSVLAIYDYSSPFIPKTYADDMYERYALTRKRYQFWRDNDEEYQAYLAYWHNKHEQFERVRPSILERVLALDDKKYYSYKQACLKALHLKARGMPIQVPRSSSLTDLYKLREALSPFCRCRNPYRNLLRDNAYVRTHAQSATAHLPFDPCPLTANDTNFTEVKQFFDENGEISHFALEYCKNLHKKMRKKIKHRVNLETTPFD